MKRLISFLTAAFLLVAGTVQAHHLQGTLWGVGRTIPAHAYCIGLNEIIGLKTAVEAEGDAGYIRIMEDLDTKCYDNRYHVGLPASVVFLQEQIMTITMPNGRTFLIWSGPALNEGMKVYIWRHIGFPNGIIEVPASGPFNRA